MVLHIVQNEFHFLFLHQMLIGAPRFAPAHERVELVEHTETFKNRACLGRALSGAGIKKLRRPAIAFAGKECHNGIISECRI